MVEGTGANGVLIVAEASGEHEARENLPLRPYAPSGAVLERCLRRMYMDRKQFAITNVVRCRPRNNWLENSPHEYSAISHCRPNLDAAIREFRPRCIVALGGIASRELTGEAGESRGVTHLAGYVSPSQLRAMVPCSDCGSKEPDCFLCGGQLVEDRAKGTIPVIVDFHPSYLRRGKASYQGVFSRILQRAVSIAAGRDKSFAWGIDPADESTWWTPAGKLQYITHPTLDQARSIYFYLKDNPRLPLAKDIETSESSSLDEDAREGFSDTEIRLVQFSYQAGTGIAIPYVNGFKSIAQDMLHLENPAFGHNWDNFDHKVIRASALREGWRYAPTNRVFDTLDMFHHWQPDLPAHLQFCSSFISFPFPWKHLAATNIEFYGICDVDADLRLGTFLEATLKRDGLWGEGEAYSLTYGYTGQEREVRPVLAAMEDRGMPIDDAARMKLGAEFAVAQRELGTYLAERAPDACRRVHPKEGFAGLPPQLRQWFRDRGTEPKYWIEHPWDDVKAMMSERWQESGKDGEGEWYTYQLRKFELSEPTTNESGELVASTTSIDRWCRVYDFNPNSSQQLLAYMKSKQHRVPKSKIEDSEGNQKDTTAAKELTRLAVKTGDDFYLKVIEYRGLTKLKGTYVDGFKPAADGCVHTTFTFSTAIAQLGARNPNTTNFPKLKPTPALANAMRAMVCAPEGKIITEMDWKSCHVITLGLLAGDANYTRLGRLDIHSAVAGHFLNLWNLNEIMKESDEQLMARFKWLKSDPDRKRVRDDQAKHGILGIGNGLRAKGLYERYMESFPPRSCPVCAGTGKVKGIRGSKNCAECKGTGQQSGLQIAEAVLATCESLFPAVFRFQEAQRQEAHTTQKLTNPFGHMRRFYEVYRWDGKKNCWGHGDQAEEAVAYRLASVAHCHMRELLKTLHRTGLAERYGLFNMVHDSIMLCHDEADAENVLRDVVPVMTAESKVLPGLWLGVEASQGRRWSEMRTVELPAISNVVINSIHPTERETITL
jgi:uracil-DNA glycosylase family 4